MAPEYYFSIAVMNAHPKARPRVSASANHGTWLPPKPRGSNIKGPSICFRHADHGTRAIARLPEDVTANKFACYSVYYDQGTFFTVNYDATENDVGDGDDTTAARGNGRNNPSESSDSSESSEDEDEDADGEEEEEEEEEGEDRTDWATMSFNLIDQRRRISYIGQRQPLQRLPYRRTDQVWADQLLPDRYGAEPAPHVQDPRHCGLLGDLPLLIALVAFGMPATYLLHTLPQCLGDTFSAPRGFPRGCGWTDRRGMVVTVYRDPESRDRENLEKYQRGGFGVIFA